MGVSGAGKSTVVQQLRNHRTKFLEDPKQRKAYIGLIHTLILNNMKTLVQKAIGLEFRWVTLPCLLLPRSQSHPIPTAPPFPVTL